MAPEVTPDSPRADAAIPTDPPPEPTPATPSPTADPPTARRGSKRRTRASASAARVEPATQARADDPPSSSPASPSAVAPLEGSPADRPLVPVSATALAVTADRPATDVRDVPAVAATGASASAAADVTTSRAPKGTPAQRAVAAALLFLAAAVLAGIAPVQHGVEYRVFGIVEGVFALLLAYLLVLRGAWAAPSGVAGWTAVVYGTVATAQVLAFLFPPPGVVQWVVVTGVAISAWSVFMGGSPRRLVASLASLAIILALIRYSVVPVLMTRIGPAAGTGFGLGDLAESARRIFADYRPVRPAGELLGFLALCCWALATRLVWSAAPPAATNDAPA